MIAAVQQTRAEFVATFIPPSKVRQARRFGIESGREGRGRFSRAEFFHNDDGRVLTEPPYRCDLYNAYKAGLEIGREERRLSNL